MSERFVDIEKSGKGKKGWEERLNAHPLLRDRMEMLLRVVENMEMWRKQRKLSWKEARLCLAHEVGLVTPVFGVTTGSADEAGDQLLQCAIRAGGGTETRFHCVGDGATWIADQGDRVFGSQANYLVDFYHLCECLAGAAGKIAGKDKEVWMEQQKDRLKENAYNEALKALQPFVEGKNIPDEDAPV